MRELIFKKIKRFQSIQKYSLVPLYEKLQLKSPDEQQRVGNDPKKLAYKITGVQLLITKKNIGGLTANCYYDFRSLMDANKYEMQEQTVNYKNRLTVSRTKIIDQHHMEGIVVETEFRHQRLKELKEGEEVEPHKRKEDLRSDYVNSGIFNDLESYRILEEVNNNALNSMPLDIMGLMDVPEINDEWFQLE